MRTFTIAVVTLLIGIAPSSYATTPGDKRVISEFIDGCALITKPESVVRQATHDEMSNAIACRVAIETGLDFARNAKKFIYLGRNVCIPVTANAREVASHIVTMSTTYAWVYDSPNLSSIVAVGIVSLYRCEADSAP